VKDPDLSIIILSYNTRELLINCLASIKNSLLRNWYLEVVVVDNGSTDKTLEMLQKEKFNWQKENLSLEIIANRKNLGFSAGNNLGVKRAKGRYILLLNSDTLVEEETISKMLAFIEENPQFGVATCRVELPDGTLDPACHRGFPTPWAALTYFLGLERLFPRSRIFASYHLGYLPMDKPHEIDSPSGAFYLVRKSIINRVGLLDEDYFMYGEDLDWSYRIKRKGFKIVYYPKVKIIHFKRRSGRQNQDPKVRSETTYYFYETMKIFYRKHYCQKYPWLVTALIFAAIDIKKYAHWD
jgi:GT2 family glycosyltransferase